MLQWPDVFIDNAQFEAARLKEKSPQNQQSQRRHDRALARIEGYLPLKVQQVVGCEAGIDQQHLARREGNSGNRHPNAPCRQSNRYFPDNHEMNIGMGRFEGYWAVKVRPVEVAGSF